MSSTLSQEVDSEFGIVRDIPLESTHFDEIHDIETHDVETHDVEIHDDDEIHDIETHDVETHDVEIHDDDEIHDVDIIEPLLDFIGDNINLPHVRDEVQAFCNRVIPHIDIQECYYKAIMLHNQEKNKFHTELLERWKIGNELFGGFHTTSSLEIMNKLGMNEICMKYPEVMKVWDIEFGQNMLYIYDVFQNMVKDDIDTINNYNYCLLCIDRVIELINDDIDIGLLGAQMLLMFLTTDGSGGYKITKPLSIEVLIEFRRYINYMRLSKIGQIVNYYKPTKENLKKAEKSAFNLIDKLMDSNTDECLLLIVADMIKSDIATLKHNTKCCIDLALVYPFIYGWIDKGAVIKATTDFEFSNETFLITRTIEELHEVVVKKNYIKKTVTKHGKILYSSRM